MKKLGMQTKGRDVKSSESRNMKFDIIKGHLCVKCNTAAMTVAVAEKPWKSRSGSASAHMAVHT